jgi:tetratricopeptide (TPR) repeat protein
MGLVILLSVGWVLFASVRPLQAYYREPKQDWRSVGSFLERSVRPGDVVVGLRGAALFARYYAPQIQTERLSEETPEAMERFLDAHERMWYVRVRSKQWQPLETWTQEHGFVTLGFRGYILVSLGRQDGAISQSEWQALLEQAVELDPDADTVWQLGQLYLERGRDQDALRCLERAVELDPTSAIAATKLGNAHRQLGNLDAAQDAYQKAIQADPAYVGAYVNLCGIFMAQERLPEAVRVCRQGTETDPTSTWAHSVLGQALLAQGDAQAAEAAFEQALELDPDWTGAQAGLARALAAQGRLSEAIESMQQAAAAQPERLGWKLELGAMLAQNGQPEEAAAVYHEILDAQPDHAQALEALEQLRP